MSMLKLQVEMKGEAYELKKGNIYLLKVLRDQATEESLHELKAYFDFIGVEVLIVRVESMGDMEMTVKEK